jgi:hypothetical protein
MLWDSEEAAGECLARSVAQSSDQIKLRTGIVEAVSVKVIGPVDHIVEVVVVVVCDQQTYSS